MKYLFLFILIYAAQSEAQIFIRTHNLQNPFNNSINITDENYKSWKDASWAPVVQVLSRDMNDITANREGSGFIFAKYKSISEKGVLILTDNHVLTDKYWNNNNDHISIRFFNQKNRAYTGMDKIGQLVTLAAASDLAVLKVSLSESEYEDIILPPILALNTIGFENMYWSPKLYKINPAEGLSLKIGYTEVESKQRTNMTIEDSVNSLAINTDSFWNIPSKYSPGMSGGPLFGSTITDQNGNVVVDYDKNNRHINYADVIFGALGFIFDTHLGSGYAYPLGASFINLVNSAESHIKNRLTHTINTQDARYRFNKNEYSIVFESETNPTEKKEIYFKVKNTDFYTHKKTSMGRVADELSTTFTVEQIPEQLGGKQLYLNMQQTIRWFGSTKRNSAGMLGAVTNGLPGGGSGTPGGGSGTPGGGSGTPGGGSGTPGGGNGTPGTDLEMSNLENAMARYYVTVYSDNNTYNITQLKSPLTGKFVPVAHLKEILLVLIETGRIHLKYGGWTGGYDAIARAKQKLIDPAVKSEIKINKLMTPINKTNVLLPSKLESISNGIFLGTSLDSNVLSGRLNFYLGKNKHGVDVNLKIRLSAYKVNNEWKMRALKIYLQEHEISSIEGIEIKIDDTSGRRVLKFYIKQEYIGFVQL